MQKDLSPSLRVLAWILSLGLLGCGLSFLLAYGITDKWFVAWEELPPAPAPIRGIAGATVTTVDVQTTTGELWRYSFSEEEPVWKPNVTPLTETDRPCEPFNRSRPLRDVVNQTVVCENYADGGSTTVYALRSSGEIYAWRANGSAYEALLLILFPAMFGPLGMAVGLVVGLAALLAKNKTCPGFIS